MKKNNLINNELNKYRENMNSNAKIILNSIKDLEVIKLNLLDTLIEFNNSSFRILGEELDITYKDVIDILEYEKGEFIKIRTNIVPPNMFTYEINNKYSTQIYTLKYALREKISELNEHWNKILLVYKFYNNYKKFDLENYYFKPYTDAIVESKLIADDSFKHISILYMGENSEVMKLEIELYNYENLNDEIKKILDNKK